MARDLGLCVRGIYRNMAEGTVGSGSCNAMEGEGLKKVDRGPSKPACQWLPRKGE